MIIFKFNEWIVRNTVLGHKTRDVQAHTDQTQKMFKTGEPYFLEYFQFFVFR